jgi:hypothetical protein
MSPGMLSMYWLVYVGLVAGDPVQAPEEECDALRELGLEVALDLEALKGGVAVVAPVIDRLVRGDNGIIRGKAVLDGVAARSPLACACLRSAPLTSQVTSVGAREGRTQGRDVT